MFKRKGLLKLKANLEDLGGRGKELSYDWINSTFLLETQILHMVFLNL